MQNGKHVILCVDDDQDILDWMKVVLEGNGYLMVGASSGEAGMKKFRETNPDFVIVDLMMEEIDAGTTLVRQLKASGAKTPIYMLSSAGDDLSITTDYTSLGLDGVFQKPIDPDFLLKVLKQKLA
jgi:two-component system, OmpR family, alkaline phosphatase synthesis response regulator PhoP